MAYVQKDSTSCLECGNEFHGLRKNRKFCSESCKNKYHNRLVAMSRNYRIKTLRALERNYSILDSLLKEGEDSIDILKARALGYDETLMTSCIRTRTMVCCCFDISFVQTPLRIRSICRITRSGM